MDTKGELAEKSKRKALIFNPLSPSAYGYNPFYLARQMNDPTPYIRDIALTLVPLPPKTKQPFFIQSAQNILTRHLLAYLRHEDSFIESIDVIQSIPAQVLLETDSQDELASRFLIQFLPYIGFRDETLGSIIAELANHIMPFATDSDIKAALSKPETITPYLLEQGNNIFIQIPEYRINQWKVLITLILQQFLTAFKSRPEGSNIPVLFLLDEFTRFGKLEEVIHGLTTLRSKKITICIIIQSLAQLDAIYGHEQRKIIADNCAYKAILSATDADTQRYLSSLVGTEERKQYSRSFGKQGSSVSWSYADKPVIKPEEFAYLHDIVLLTPRGHGRVDKVPYYTLPTG